MVGGEGDAAFIIPRMRLRPLPAQPFPRPYGYGDASEAGSYGIWMLVSVRHIFRMTMSYLQHPGARDFGGFLSDFATHFSG